MALAARRRVISLPLVVTGLDPVFPAKLLWNGRVKRGHDEEERGCHQDGCRFRVGTQLEDSQSGGDVI